MVSDYLLDSGYYLAECSCNELNKQSSKVMEKAGSIRMVILQIED